jgi:HAMP domain-containing protein
LTVEALALLVAVALPVTALAALVGVIASIRELERSRDELSGLDPARR